METLKIKKLKPWVMLPNVAHEGDAGFDFYCPDEVYIPDGARGFKVPLGIAVGIPKGHYLEITVRSSTGVKTPLRLSNSVGIVDEGYIGEICLILDNLREGEGKWRVGQHERIAQGILKKKTDVKVIEVKELEETGRGKDGFGSTGR